GRVFDDVNDNGAFDKGDSGLEGVRVVLATGQSATTDRNGMFSIPAIESGTTTIALDPSTMPAGYGLAHSARVENQGWSRLVRTPLNGGALVRQNFALARTAAPAAAAS